MRSTTTNQHYNSLLRCYLKGTHIIPFSVVARSVDDGDGLGEHELVGAVGVHVDARHEAVLQANTKTRQRK